MNNKIKELIQEKESCIRLKIKAQNESSSLELLFQK